MLVCFITFTFLAFGRGSYPERLSNDLILYTWALVGYGSCSRALQQHLGGHFPGSVLVSDFDTVSTLEGFTITIFYNFTIHNPHPYSSIADLLLNNLGFLNKIWIVPTLSPHSKSHPVAFTLAVSRWTRANLGGFCPKHKGTFLALVLWFPIYFCNVKSIQTARKATKMFEEILLFLETCILCIFWDYVNATKPASASCGQNRPVC